ncbi:MAG: CPBP family intramembrane metalloprotease [Verrucomicrobia bacterium]|jgi:membrane protease YdiL (CAAX protease family)|nr:CPBP family intramembrane metalloprotease [Verrucomicrobiota bacterium]
MESQPVDPPLVITSLLFLGVLGTSLLLWVQHLRTPQDRRTPEPGISAWPIGWVNFGIFICTLVVTIVAVQTFTVALFFDGPPDPDSPRELTPWLAIAGVLFLQLPMLAAFYGLRRTYPAHFAGRLNDVALAPNAAFKQALPLFIRYLPIVWLAALIWGGLLGGLEAAGLIEGVEPQELVSLFQAGGDPLAIGLLVLMAVVLAPIVEEIIFRGCLYRFLKSQTTHLPAQLISGSLFALMHANLFSFIPLAVVGVLLARVYERSGHLLVPIWFHAFFNGFSLLMLYVTSQSQFVPQ